MDLWVLRDISCPSPKPGADKGGLGVQLGSFCTQTSPAKGATMPLISDSSKQVDQRQSLASDDMILYIENPKVLTNKPQELINVFSNVAGYKINIQKSVVFLYINNELTEGEIKKTMPFTIATKKIPRNKLNQRYKRSVLKL